MSIEVRLEGQLETEKDFEAVLGLFKELCEKMHLKMEAFEHFALIDVCPEGFVECSYKDSYITVSAQTNVAGPGFHAYVCTLFDEIIKISPMELATYDPTGYFETRDFDKLKHDVFFRWLQDIGNYVLEAQEEGEDLFISWPLDYYRPKAKKGFVVTPMGYIAVNDFQSDDMDAIANRFFVWNQIGRDALYYRSAAINLLWKECYYTFSNMNEYTEKMADTILDYLEIAHKLDASLPLPMEEYYTLCEILNREKVIQEATSMYIQDLGYRKQSVHFYFGNWSIPAHGCSEKSVDESNGTLYLMAPYASEHEPWRWMYKVNVFSFQQPITNFLKEIEAKANTEDFFAFEDAQLSAKGYVEKRDDHIVLHAQLLAQNEMMMIEIIICHEEDIAERIADIKQIKCHKINDTDIKN